MSIEINPNNYTFPNRFNKKLRNLEDGSIGAITFLRNKKKDAFLFEQVFIHRIRRYMHIYLKGVFDESLRDSSILVRKRMVFLGPNEMHTMSASDGQGSTVPLT